MALDAMGNIPASETLGSFDEESCRFFLGQVGRSIVPYYPFETGMEEVYCLILEKYGHAGIPDATSVLQELLEDDGSMLGFGDDGDIWRAWHYRWKHRNDNALSPLIPRIGNFVLQPPTSRSIRQVKAANFLKLNRDSIVSNYNQSPDWSPNERTMPKGPTFSHQRYRLKLPEEVDMNPDMQEVEHASSRNRTESLSSYGQDSQQDFEEVTSDTDIELDPSLLITFEMMERPYLSNGEDLNLRGGNQCILRQVISSPKARRSSKLETEMPKTSRCAVQIGPSEMPWSNDQDARENIGRLPKEVFSSQQSKLRRTEFSDATRPSIRSRAKFPQIKINHDNNISPIEPFSRRRDTEQSVQEQRAPKAGQVTNRHARLIDGAIFTTRSRKSKEDIYETPKENEVEVRENRKALVRRSWTTNRQKDEIRHSWLQRARSLLRPERNSKQHDSVSSVPQSTSEETSSQRSEMRSSHRRVASEVSEPGSILPKRNLRLLLDGAGDDQSSSSSSALDLNKSLPLSPVDIVHSLLNNVQIPQMSQPQDKLHQLHARPCLTSAFRSGMTKTEFRGLACELVGNSICEQSQSSASFEGTARLEPKKNAFTTPHSPPRSPMTFSSISNRNPFTDDPVPLTPSFNQRIRARTAEAGVCPTPPTVELRYNLFNNPDLGTDTRDDRTFFNRPSEEHSSPEQVRGRRDKMATSCRPRQISLSPNRGEKTELLKIPERKVKRSRSPVKRMFGLGKSSSMKELSRSLPEGGEQNGPEVPTKKSLRNWGSKLRHGFLNADREQFESEEYMEQHMKEEFRSSLEPALPVSLAPAYQARIQYNLELMISGTANRFLLNESHAGRVSDETLIKVQRTWDSRGLPNVTECHYDQSTQRALVMMNLSSVHFKGQCAEDPMCLNATMHSWATLAKELSIRMFCWPDGSVRKHLHDAQQIIEMLGAPSSITLSLQSLQVKVLTKINQIQKEKLEMKSGSFCNKRNASESSKNSVIHKRTISDGSWPEAWTGVEDNFEALNFDANLSPQIKMRKATGAEGAIIQGRSPRVR